MPETIWAAIRTGSPGARRREIRVKSVAPMQMKIIVRRPAALSRDWRSMPISPPTRTETPSAIRSCCKFMGMRSDTMSGTTVRRRGPGAGTRPPATIRP